MTSGSQTAGSHPPQPPAPAEFGRCDTEESEREKGESRHCVTLRPPSPLLRVARVHLPQMTDSGFNTHTTRHCEGHLVLYTDPLTGMNKDGASTILGGTVGPPAAMRRQTAAMKRTCSAIIAEGGGALVPLLWPDALTSSEIEWSEAFEADETEAAPVAFFCTGCVGRYSE